MADLRRRGTKHAPAESRRAQILEAARERFSMAGYEGTTMDDVAEASGLSKGSVYRFFPSKDALLKALLEHFEAEVLTILGEVNVETDALGALERYGAALCGAVEARRGLVNAFGKFFSSPEGAHRLAALYDVSRRRLADVIGVGIDDGTIRSVSLDSAASTVLAAVEGMLLQGMADPAFNASTLWPSVWEILELGLATEGEATRPKPGTRAPTRKEQT